MIRKNLGSRYSDFFGVNSNSQMWDEGEALAMTVSKTRSRCGESCHLFLSLEYNEIVLF